MAESNSMGENVAGVSENVAKKKKANVFGVYNNSSIANMQRVRARGPTGFAHIPRVIADTLIIRRAHQCAPVNHRMLGLTLTQG